MSLEAMMILHFGFDLHHGFSAHGLRTQIYPLTSILSSRFVMLKRPVGPQNVGHRCWWSPPSRPFINASPCSARSLVLFILPLLVLSCIFFAFSNTPRPALVRMISPLASRRVRMSFGGAWRLIDWICAEVDSLWRVRSIRKSSFQVSGSSREDRREEEDIRAQMLEFETFPLLSLNCRPGNFREAVNLSVKMYTMSVYLLSANDSLYGILTFNCLPKDAILSCLNSFWSTSLASWAVVHISPTSSRAVYQNIYSIWLRDDELSTIWRPVDGLGTEVWAQSKETRLY